jgi:hypothetical protein
MNITAQLITPETKKRVPLRFGVAENHEKMALPVDRR